MPSQQTRGGLSTKSVIIILVLLFNIFSIYNFNRKLEAGEEVQVSSSSSAEQQVIIDSSSISSSDISSNNTIMMMMMEARSYDFKDPNKKILYYLEHKPKNTPSQPDFKYPVFIFLHGASKSGRGLKDLNEKLRTAVIPKYIESGQWDAASLPFLVICPQSSEGWSEENIDDVLKAIKDTYGDIIDPTRIYLTGQSMGGGGIWRWAKSNKDIDTIAALIVICGASPSPNKSDKNEMAISNIPVWAFHNELDETIPSRTSRNWVEFNNEKGINPPSKLTIFEGKNGHDAWTQAFNPVKKDNPIYVYDWLLSYSTNRKTNRQ